MYGSDDLTFMKSQSYIAVVNDTGELNGHTVLCSNTSVAEVEKEIIAKTELGEIDPDVPVVIFEMKKTVMTKYKVEWVTQ